jgi:glycosyltransferase involved in cell wall biosynthesis
MNILQIAPRVPFPPDDGGKIGIFNITKYLSLREHNITLVTFENSLDTKKDYSELQNYCKLFLVPKNLNNSVSGIVKSLFSEVPYNIQKYISQEMLKTINQLLQAEEFDIVHVDGLHMAYYGIEIKKFFDIPITLREHNIESIIMKRVSENTKNILIKSFTLLQYKKIYSYEKYVTNEFDKCVVITKEDENTLKKLNPKAPTVVIPAGVDLNFFYPLSAKEVEFSIVFVGSFDWYPNVEGVTWFLKKIYPIIKQKTPLLKLYIVGKNPPESIISFNSPNIIVTGYVKDVRDYVAKSQVFIVPLRIGGGMRIKIIEAMAMGKAVVSTSIGAEGIEAKNNEEIIIKDREEGLANAITDLLVDEEKRKRIGEKALELVKEKYMWEKVAENFEKEYLKLIR